jgi:hypothetical protein
MPPTLSLPLEGKGWGGGEPYAVSSLPLAFLNLNSE